ncbi:MAG: dihydropteroate synthase [Gemmataceae bacterium]|jgi:dihydropteroate synthase-like protein|nr:MAG: dihydropteroate synthase [Gemmataceae bacterium]
MIQQRKRWLFVTGKLAEPALRRIVAELSQKLDFDYQIVTLNISVAALMTTEWIARHFPKNVLGDIILLPGLCRGSSDIVTQATGIPARHGPHDLLDLPEFFNLQTKTQSEDYGKYDIEIIAEINNVPHKPWELVIAEAQKYHQEGADIIDIGCEPGTIYHEVYNVIQKLCDLGFHISIDSIQPEEIEIALNAGAELVLSINSTNIKHVQNWLDRFPNVEFVVIPDTPSDLSSLYKNAERLIQWGARIRLDPILEPIGHGFLDSLLRYINVRKEYPDIPMLMGVANLTELTEVDSAGINVLLAAICQELRIQSVLTTSVANWCRSSVKELDLARRLVYYAIRNQTIPKRIVPNLVLLRDSKLREIGESSILELANNIKDPNYRIIAERGFLHIFNNVVYLQGTDPFKLFRQLLQIDHKISPSHAFYLGYEMAKAKIALTLHKNYTQDQPLNWGFLTPREDEINEDIADENKS